MTPPRGRAVSIHSECGEHSLAFTPYTVKSLIFMLTAPHYRPFSMSTEPLEHTQAAPGPLVDFSWSGEVAEHSPSTRP